MKMVVIASSPRVGSSLVSELLTQAEAGYVSEHFNLSVHVPEVAKENGLKSLEEHLDFITEHYASTDGEIFTVKCHFDQYFNYAKRVDITSRFTKIEFIQIKRRSTLDQAISYFLAKATNTWSTRNIDDIDKHNQKVLDALKKIPSKNLYEEIMRMKFRLNQNEAYWDFYLQDQDREIFYYEDLLGEAGIGRAEEVFSRIYNKRIKIDRAKSALKVQRNNEITELIKHRISPYLRTLPPMALLDKCLKFNNSFYG